MFPPRRYSPRRSSTTFAAWPADVCPKYTVRIIHYELPEGMSCATAGGVEESVPVPVAITVMQKTFCFPKPLVAAGQHFTR